LYAQPNANGYQLIDSTPRVIFKIKNSQGGLFLGTKGDANGCCIKKTTYGF
jgi:allophanate hydrolase subunit 1